MINTYLENLKLMDFYTLESKDCVRMSWNNLPSTKLETMRAVLPIGVHYTPFKETEEMPMEYEPLRSPCGAVLNPFS